jgi:hypothetical protein
MSQEELTCAKLDLGLIMIENTTESIEKQKVERSKWGGKRPGAGRRPREVEKWIKARGLSPATAAELLERADERRVWYRLLHSEDEAIALRALIYLTDRRDGRPAQQINVTAATVHFTPEEIERARAIARQLGAKPQPTLSTALEPES